MEKTKFLTSVRALQFRARRFGFIEDEKLEMTKKPIMGKWYFLTRYKPKVRFHRMLRRIVVVYTDAIYSMYLTRTSIGNHFVITRNYRVISHISKVPEQEAMKMFRLLAYIEKGEAHEQGSDIKHDLFFSDKKGVIVFQDSMFRKKQKYRIFAVPEEAETDVREPDRALIERCQI